MTPSAGPPDPRVPARGAAALRRGYVAGRATHGAFDLSFEKFAARAVLLAELRLRRMGVEPSPDALGEALERAALADLYLAVACDMHLGGAWDRLVAAFSSTIVALAVRRGARPDEAEQLARELPGELFVPPPGGDARSRIGTYDGGGSLTGWLAVIVQRRLADRARSSAAVRPAPTHGELPARDALACDAIVDAETRGRFELALREAWQSLTPRESLVLVLRYRDGVAQRAIARLLDIGEARVSRILAQATQKARDVVVRRLGGEPAGSAHAAGDVWAALAGTVAESLTSLGRRPDLSALRTTTPSDPTSGADRKDTSHG